MDFPEPVPRPLRYRSAADAAIQLARFTALYVWVGVWLWLLFLFVDLSYPDRLDALPGPEYLRSSLRWAFVLLVIAYPLYLWLSRTTRRSLDAGSERERSRIHSWLIWLTMLTTSAALLGDLASLLYHFLGGELGTRFLLKTAIVAVVAVGLFLFYRAELGADRDTPVHRTTYWLGPAAALALGISVLVAFWLAGSPNVARNRLADRHRLGDLRMIKRAVDQYWQKRDRLPPDLAALSDLQRPDHLDIHDPLTKQRYTYSLEGEREYRLCARFDTASGRNLQPVWRHRRGKACFKLKAETLD